METNSFALLQNRTKLFGTAELWGLFLHLRLRPHWSISLFHLLAKLTIKYVAHQHHITEWSWWIKPNIHTGHKLTKKFTRFSQIHALRIQNILVSA